MHFHHSIDPTLPPISEVVVVLVICQIVPGTRVEDTIAYRDSVVVHYSVCCLYLILIFILIQMSSREATERVADS